MRVWLACIALVWGSAFSGCGSNTVRTDAGGDSSNNASGGKSGSGGVSGTAGGAAAGGTEGSGTGGTLGTAGSGAGGAATNTGGANPGGSSGASGGRGGNAGGTGGRASGGTAGNGGGGGGRGGATGGAMGGRGGAGGAPGSEGGGGSGVVACGTATCGAGQFCCNASCNLCAPAGVGCIQIACTDGGISRGCVAVPSSDSRCSGTTPHYFRCVLLDLPPPCVARSIGDVTNTYCCP